MRFPLTGQSLTHSQKMRENRLDVRRAESTTPCNKYFNRCRSQSILLSNFWTSQSIFLRLKLYTKQSLCRGRAVESDPATWVLNLFHISEPAIPICFGQNTVRPSPQICRQNRQTHSIASPKPKGTIKMMGTTQQHSPPWTIPTTRPPTM